MSSPAAQATEEQRSGSLVSPQRRNFIFVAVLFGMLLAALGSATCSPARPSSA